MLSSISPVGEATRRQRWWLTATAYLLGSIAGGAAVGASLGAVGAGLSLLAPGLGDGATGFALLGAVALAGLALERRGRLPGWRRQVNERWLDEYRGWVYGAGFGFQLGAGAATIVVTSAVYVTFAAALLVGSVAGGALIGATFGLVRALPLLATVRQTTPERMRGFHRAFAAAEPTANRVAHAVQSVVAGGAVLMAVT